LSKSDDAAEHGNEAAEVGFRASQLIPVFGDSPWGRGWRAARGSMRSNRVVGQVKRAVLDLARRHWEGRTLEDVQYQLYAGQKVEHSIRATAARRVTSDGQVKTRLAKWLAW
jgi:hypothetical protein